MFLIQRQLNLTTVLTTEHMPLCCSAGAGGAAPRSQRVGYCSGSKTIESDNNTEHMQLHCAAGVWVQPPEAKRSVIVSDSKKISNLTTVSCSHIQLHLLHCTAAVSGTAPRSQRVSYSQPTSCTDTSSPPLVLYSQPPLVQSPSSPLVHYVQLALLDCTVSPLDCTVSPSIL